MIYVPSKSEEDWKQLLVEPDKQWMDGHSAKCLATCWQNADKIPEKVKQVFENTSCTDFTGVEMLFGIPEYKVALPGGGCASQNDLFVLAKTNKQILPIMVEGKVNESFGPLVVDWEKGMSTGKEKRLQYLCDLLNLKNKNINNIRYQLLHRTASAIITANKYHSNTAVVLIHSFSQSNKSFIDYSNFINLYNLKAQLDGIIGPVILNEVKVYWGWVKDQV